MFNAATAISNINSRSKVIHVTKGVTVLQVTPMLFSDSPVCIIASVCMCIRLCMCAHKLSSVYETAFKHIWQRGINSFDGVFSH